MHPLPSCITGLVCLLGAIFVANFRSLLATVSSVESIVTYGCHESNVCHEVSYCVEYEGLSKCFSIHFDDTPRAQEFVDVISTDGLMEIVYSPIVPTIAFTSMPIWLGIVAIVCAFSSAYFVVTALPPESRKRTPPDYPMHEYPKKEQTV